MDVGARKVGGWVEGARIRILGVGGGAGWRGEEVIFERGGRRGADRQWGGRRFGGLASWRAGMDGGGVGVKEGRYEGL